jgi:hypothetical protein
VSLTIDTNGNYQYTKNFNKDIQSFLWDAHLAKPFYAKFKILPWMHLWGKKWIDLALVDISSMQAICSIEYLGTNKGTDLDHVVGYIDWDKQMFLQGLVNRPMRMWGRPIIITQIEKIKTYPKTLIPNVEEKIFTSGQ